MKPLRRVGLWLCAFFLFAPLVSPVLQAAAEELDLIPDARLRVSGVADLGGFPLDSAKGRAALRDENPDTAWHPAEDAPAWIEIGISSTGEVLGITLGGIRLTWGDGSPEVVTVTAGPDRESQRVVARVHVVNPDYLDITPVREEADVQVVFLHFEGRRFSVAELSLFAVDSPSLGPVSSPTLARVDGEIRISYDWPTHAHHVEIERRMVVGEDDEIHTWTSTASVTADRPPRAGNPVYRLRAVDYRGKPGPWSQTVESSGYEPENPDVPAWRGVVEGFYGQPWSHRTRLDTVRQLGVWGMNAYVYAPKDDVKHRTTWREPYNTEELAHFADLLALGQSSGVHIHFGISPGLSIDPLSASDLEALLDKFTQLLDLGCINMVLLMDDIPTAPDGVSGANHALLVNRLLAALREKNDSVTLWFVPTVYSATPGRINADQRAYLNALKTIDPDVLIAWTGESTFDETITADEIQAVSELVGHSLWLWDNYPVNDSDLALGLHLAPVRGRDTALLRSERLSAVTVNPMVEGRASWFALSSWARLLADPEGYDPDLPDLESLSIALDPACDPAALKTLQSLFMAFHDWDGMEDAPELSEAVETFITRLSLGTPTEIRDAADVLKTHLVEILKAADDLEWHCTARGLADEMAGRLTKLSALAEGALLAVDLLQSDLYGWRQVFHDTDARLERLATGPLLRIYPIAENTLQRLVTLARGPENSRPVKRLVGRARVEPIIADPLPQARVGQRWYFDAGFGVLPEGVTWSVTADESLQAEFAPTGRLSLTPQEPGRTWIRVDATRDDVTISRVFPLVVVPALHELDRPTLPMTSELVKVNGLPVLLQNGVVTPDAAMCQYARMSLAGTWKKRRATVDHRLTFAARDDAVLDRLELEACGAHLPDFDMQTWDDITLPAVENRLPPTAHPSGPEEYWGGVWYRREVPVPQGGQRIRLVMLAADYIVDVWADGYYLGWHEGGYSPVYLPLPDDLSDRESLILTLRVDRPRPGDMPGMLPSSPDSDWWLYAGIVQDLYWEYLPASQDAVIARASVLPLSMTGLMQVDVVLEELKGREQDVIVKVEAFQTNRDHASYWSQTAISGALGKAVDVVDNTVELTLVPGERHALRLTPKILAASHWEPRYPRIYAVRVRLLDAEKRTLDRATTQTGFREIAIQEDGALTFNVQRAFWPGVARHEDSPEAGRTMSWSRTLSDLRLAKSQGAMLLRAGHYPNHPDLTVIADRLGLVVMNEIPAWWLDAPGFKDQAERGLALQMWREMIFQNMSRPSVLFWGTCNECRPTPDSAAMRAFIQELHEDLDTHYPDGRFVTQSLAANWYDLGGSETLEAVDVAGFTSYFGVFYGNGDTVQEDTAAFLTRVREDFPLLPVLITEYGRESFADQSGSVEQVSILEDVWKAVQPVASVNEKRKVNADGYVVGLTWWTLTDWYTIGIGLQTMGLYGMDRATWKPAAERLRALYLPYTRGPIDTGKNNIPVRRTGVSECASSGGDLAPWLWLLLVLGLVARRTRLGPRRIQNLFAARRDT